MQTCIAPVSSPELQTIRLNTSTDSQVSHSCRDGAEADLFFRKFHFLSGHPGDSACNHAPAKCFFKFCSPSAHLSCAYF